MNKFANWCQESFLQATFVLSLSMLGAAAQAGVVYDNGGPDHASGNNMGIALQADDFNLAAPNSLTRVHYWSIEAPGDYRGGIFWALASDASGSPGSFISSGFQSAVSRVSTGLTVLNLNEFENEFALNVPVALGAGHFWLVLHNGIQGDLGDPNDYYWETAANNATIRGQESYDNGASWDTNVNEHAFFLIAADAPVQVPEPSSIWIALAGISLFAGVRRSGAAPSGRAFRGLTKHSTLGWLK